MQPTHRGRAAVRGFMWGLAAAALYLVAVAYTWPLAPIRILYEGEAPPLPYRWVHPPAELSRDNQPPEFGAGRIAFSPQGSQSTSIVTDDGQADALCWVSSEGGIGPAVEGQRDNVLPRLQPDELAGDNGGRQREHHASPGRRTPAAARRKAGTGSAAGCATSRRRTRTIGRRFVRS